MSAEADSGVASGEEVQITFTVKASNDQKFTLTLPAATSVGDLKTKLSGSDHADIPTDRIRLIYSGRVLKDTDTLANAKLKDGHTIHMVKGAASNARQNPANQPASQTTSQAPGANVPTNIAAGTGNNPLAAMTGARYAGFHGLPNPSMFGADGGMGPPPGPDEMLRMLEDPAFLQQMNEMMDNPSFQQMMENSPMLQNNPMARQMLRDPNMRRMMFSPQMMRMQLEMQRNMGGDGIPGMGGSSFPAPGVTDTTPQTAQSQQQQQGGSTPQPPSNTTASQGAGAGTQMPNLQGLNSLFGMPAGGNTQANPFAALFGAPPTGAQASTPGQTTGSGAAQGQNPFAQLMSAMNNSQPNAPSMAGGAGDPQGDAFMGQLLRAMQGGQPTQQTPPDTRPPEERYADQLRQLNDMGFYEFDRNVQALRQSGGSVQGAVEFLLTHP